MGYWGYFWETVRDYHSPFPAKSQGFMFGDVKIRLLKVLTIDKPR